MLLSSSILCRYVQKIESNSTTKQMIPKTLPNNIQRGKDISSLNAQGIRPKLAHLANIRTSSCSKKKTKSSSISPTAANPKQRKVEAQQSSNSSITRCKNNLSRAWRLLNSVISGTEASKPKIQQQLPCNYFKLPCNYFKLPQIQKGKRKYKTEERRNTAKQQLYKLQNSVFQSECTL